MMFSPRLRQPLHFAASLVVFILSLITFTLFSANALYARNYYPIQTKLQATSGITLPVAGSAVSGTVIISGTATTENFAKYELHYKPAASDDDGYIYFGGATALVIENQLALWETTNLPNGTYTLRLRVVDENGNYVEYTTPEITVSQDIAQPMSTVTPNIAVPQSSEASPGGEVTGEVAATMPHASASLTVTITGGNDPAQVETFLRYLLAGYAPQSGYITATIGSLPADLMLDLPLPDEAVVVGGYVRKGIYDENQLLIAATGSLDDLVETIWQSFMAQGFSAPVDGAGHGPGQVFLPQDSVLPDALCSPDGALMIYHSRTTVQDAPPVLRLNIAPVPALFGPCSSAQNNAGPAYGILPQLLPPPGAQLQASGGGGGSDMVAAEAEIQTTLSATDLAAHYTAQLEDAGWEALGDSAAEAIAWSTWRFHDEQENEWSATFYVVQLGDAPAQFLATLRAVAASSNDDNSSADTITPAATSNVNYYYTQSEGVVRVTTTFAGRSFTALVTQEREIWLGSDGSGRIRQEYRAPVFFSDDERTAWEDAGSPGMVSSMDQTFGVGELAMDHLDELSTDVAVLTQEIRAMAAATDNPLAWQMFDNVSSLLREMPHTQEMHQALFQVGSEIEGVEVSLQSEDRLGRPAIALSHVGTMNETTTRRTLFFAPESYQLLGAEETLLEPTQWFDAAPGASIGWTTYLYSGYVDSTTSAPQSRDVASPTN